MPLYEYHCEECGRSFTLLQPMSAPHTGWTCPHCGSTQSRRKLSTFASRSGSAGSGAAVSAGAGCAPGG